MPDPFTIRILVPDGYPEEVRLIDRMIYTPQIMVRRRNP
jgi:hypothetical protein